MKQFYFDGCFWSLSKCGNFVSMHFDSETGEENEGQSGWFPISQFTDELKAAAKQAK